jgi:hypothetical protein
MLIDNSNTRQMHGALDSEDCQRYSVLDTVFITGRTASVVCRSHCRQGGRLLGSLAGVFLAMSISPEAMAAPSTTELQKYLVIATGAYEDAFDMDGGELGADQEVVSSGSGNDLDTQEHSSYTDIGIDLTGTFVETDGATPFNSNNRWTDSDPDHVDGDTVGVSDFLPGAKPLAEAPDYSGNVAITAVGGGFTSENADYFADIGIQCADSAAACYTSDDKDNSWKESDSSAFVNLGDGTGVSTFDPAALLQELDEWSTFINSLDTEFTITSNIVDQSYKDGGTPYVTNLDDIDADGDGFAVIEIDVEGDFKVSNSDWILYTLNDVTAIFRIAGENDSNYLFDNSSIMMGPGCLDGEGNPTTALTCEDEPVTELGAIFLSDHSAGNEVFNLSNVILGGIALWDLDQDDTTYITMNNVQGCAQFVGSRVQMSSKERFNRCSFAESGPPTAVPEPSVMALYLTAMLVFGLGRYLPRRA